MSEYQYYEFAAIDRPLTREEMAALLKLLAQGRGAEAERQVRSRHAAWLKARRPSPGALAPQRSVAQLYEVAEVARGTREAQAAKERAAQQAEQRRQREAHLRRLMDDVDRQWAAIEAQVERGIASTQEQAVQILVELKQAHALAGRREAFDVALRRFVERHARRSALQRRLVKAGLKPL